MTFSIDGFRKHCLLNGLDDIGITLQNEADIRAYEERRRQQQIEEEQRRQAAERERQRREQERIRREQERQFADPGGSGFGFPGSGGNSVNIDPESITRVYAVDVGYGQLDWKLRNDPRIVVREKLNARYLKPED